MVNHILILDLKPPPRKDFGTVGRRIRVFTNHFEMKMKNNNQLAFHYDVEFDKKYPKKFTR